MDEQRVHELKAQVMMFGSAIYVDTTGDGCFVGPGYLVSPRAEFGGLNYDLYVITKAPDPVCPFYVVLDKLCAMDGDTAVCKTDPMKCPLAWGNNK
jgi:hypothetical protein